MVENTHEQLLLRTPLPCRPLPRPMMPEATYPPLPPPPPQPSRRRRSPAHPRPTPTSPLLSRATPCARSATHGATRPAASASCPGSQVCPCDPAPCPGSHPHSLARWRRGWRFRWRFRWRWWRWCRWTRLSQAAQRLRRQRGVAGAEEG